MENIWKKCLLEIGNRVGPHTMELWFSQVRLIGIEDGNAVIEIPNRFFKEWIEDNYPDMLTSIITGNTGKEITGIKYTVENKEDSSVKRKDTRLENRKSKLASKGIFLNPKYTFKTFVTGESNRFAYAACKAVSEDPGKKYNPLFIYGGVGLGKTHLINAVGNSLVDKRTEEHIVHYVSSEQFTNEVVHAVRHGNTDKLKARYRNLDILLMDDVQFLEKKSATQEELFHTINSLYERQKQIIMTSDRPPKEIAEITDRLRSRFNMGLIADIQPPDVETKIAILHKKADNEKLVLPEDVVLYLATRIKSNIRELEGCLIRLGAHASLSGSKITLEMAKNVLKDIIYFDDKPLGPETIMKEVAEHYGIKVAEMKTRKRTREIAIPRQVAMYISREITESSLSDIGKTIGGKDHATVIYACKQIDEKRKKDEVFDRMVEGLITKLKP